MSPRRLVLSDIEAIGARIKEAPTPDARESLIELLFADLRNDIAEGICPNIRLYSQAASEAAGRNFE